MNLIYYLKSLFEKPDLMYFNVNLVDHCNLNCMYCDHFSPLCPESYVNINNLKKDFKRMSSLVNIKHIGLMGGEPLLHPELVSILKMARRTLKKTRLTIYTNGILLSKQSDEFWETCKKYYIFISISRYPIKIDLEKIEELSKKYSVPVSFYGGSLLKYKKMFKLSFDLDGKQDPVEMSNLCWQNKGSCSYLRDGHFYKCTTAGHIHNLSNYFNLDLYPSSEDYIDIYKIKKGKEIIDFYKRIIPFCRFCNIKNQQSNLEFQISNKKVSEWI